jgi:hypothetical protein
VNGGNSRAEHLLTQRVDRLITRQLRIHSNLLWKVYYHEMELRMGGVSISRRVRERRAAFGAKRGEIKVHRNLHTVRSRRGLRAL